MPWALCERGVGMAVTLPFLRVAPVDRELRLPNVARPACRAESSDTMMDGGGTQSVRTPSCSMPTPPLNPPLSSSVPS